MSMEGRAGEAPAPTLLGIDVLQNLRDVLPFRRAVSDRDANSVVPAQPRVRYEQLSGRIHLFDQLRRRALRRRFIIATDAEDDHAERRRREQLDPFPLLQLLGKPRCESDLIANDVAQTLDAIVLEDHPQLQRT